MSVLISLKGWEFNHLVKFGEVTIIADSGISYLITWHKDYETYVLYRIRGNQSIFCCYVQVVAL